MLRYWHDQIKTLEETMARSNSMMRKARLGARIRGYKAKIAAAILSR